MTYLKRFGLASASAFAVLVSYTLALKLPSQLNPEVFLAILVGALVCCVVAGLLAAVFFRKNPIVMVLCAQILSVVMVGVVWRL